MRATTTAWECLGGGIVCLMGCVWWIVTRTQKRRFPARNGWLAVAHGTCAGLFLLGLSQYKDTFRYDILRDGTVLHTDERPWLPTAMPLGDAVGRRCGPTENR